MENQNITGIYFYFSQNNNSINFQEIIEYIGTIPNIRINYPFVTEKFTKIDKLVEEFRNDKLQRVIIAGDFPGMVKSLFTSAMVQAGNRAEDVILVSFNELGIFDNFNKDKATVALMCAIFNLPYEKLTSTFINPVNQETLVIGGGIAGIQASLEIANANKKVYLVERTGTIGGHMAMFDKTFPTLDCAACILTPKMVEVGQHTNIDLLTYSNVIDVTGTPGKYKVKILKKARKVDLVTCIGCGSCSARCPNEVPSEFDSKISLRKAIYIPFPQAVPNKYLVDDKNCRYIDDPFEITPQTIKELKKAHDFPIEIVEKLSKIKNKKIKDLEDFNNNLTELLGNDAAQKYGNLIYKHSGKCKNCIRFCPVNDCINLDEQDKEVEINVGNIVVATGFKTFDAQKADHLGYGKFPNVLSSLELERLINAAGPTEGKITLRTEDKKGNKIFVKDGIEPKSVALIHCVGSRDINHNQYCSKVCCMYSLKLAHLVKEKLPEAKVSEYYIDMRAFGKGYEEFYERIKNEGIHIIRGKTAKIDQLNGEMKLYGENILEDKLIEQKVDMVVLAVGLEAQNDAKDIAEILNISISENGWFNESHSDKDTTGTLSGGITIAGVCQGPKDIPDSVAQASAAAAKVLQSIIKGEIRESVKNTNFADIKDRIIKEEIEK